VAAGEKHEGEIETLEQHIIEPDCPSFSLAPCVLRRCLVSMNERVA
jgi:hypothetical protein